MSNLKVNIISPYTGSTVTIIGFNATGSLEGTASYADVSATASYATGYTLQTDFDTFTGSYTTDSSSFNSRITAQEQFSSSLDTTFVNETEFANYTGSADSRFASLEIESGSIRSDFNVFTASYTADSSSFDSRVTDLETFSSSLDTSFVSEIEFGSYTGSNDLRVSALELESGSIRTDFNTYTSSADLRFGALEQESGSIRTDFNSFTSSYIIDSGSFNTRVTDLETFSSSLDNIFVNETDFATYTGSVDLVLNALETESGSIRNDLNSYTGSNDLRVTALEQESGSIRTTLNSYTASSDLRLNSLEIESGSIRTDFNIFTSSYTTGSFTGSFTGDGSGLTDVTATTASYYVEADPIFTAVSGTYATTGSNTFNGTQIINGDVTISGTASIDYLHVTYESASVIYSSGSNQLGDEVSDIQTLIGSTIISGSISVTGSANIPAITGSLQGTATNANTASYILGANVDGAVNVANTASFITLAQTASYVENAVTASYILPLTQNVIITGSLTVSGSNVSLNTPEVNFDTNHTAVGHIPGRLSWNGADGTLDLDTLSTGVTLQVGQEQHIYGRNTSGVTINNGDAVRIVGAQGDNAIFEKAIALDNPFSATDRNEIIGIATETIADGDFGYITTFGKVRGINTLAFATGSILYVSHTVSGSLVTSKPPAPYSIMRAGIVIRSAADGIIFCRPKDPVHLNDITGITGSNIPAGPSYWTYDSASGISSLTNQLTASLQGTASYANTSTSASYILGSNVDGTVVSASYAVTASHALNVPATASYALSAETASYILGSNVSGAVETANTASYINGSLVKSGQIDGTTFAGNPKTGTITFATPFPDNNYSIMVTGEDIRTWTIESKVSGSFVINSNSNPALAGNVFWQAINFGEHNY